MNGRPWIPKEDRSLRTLYPHLRSDDIAMILGRPLSSVYQRAAKLRLKKSEAYNRSPLSGRMVPGFAPYGVAYRFPKGHVPANKGPRRPGYAPGRMRETQFRKGQWPANKDRDFYVLGALRVDPEGFIQMRVSFAPGGCGWRYLHRMLWEDAYGPIPHAHVLRFKDRDRLNVCLENLELVSCAENMRRNSVHHLPRPLKQTVQLLGALNRKLNRRTREEQDRRSAQPSV